MSDQKPSVPPAISALILALANALILLGIYVCGETFELNQNNDGIVIRLKWSTSHEKSPPPNAPHIPSDHEKHPPKRKKTPSRIRKNLSRLAAYFTKKAANYPNKQHHECHFNDKTHSHEKTVITKNRMDTETQTDYLPSCQYHGLEVSELAAIGLPACHTLIELYKLYSEYKQISTDTDYQQCDGKRASLNRELKRIAQHIENMRKLFGSEKKN